MSNWAIGIISGLVAGLMQSCSYLGDENIYLKGNKINETSKD